MRILWLEPFLALYIESEAMPTKSLIVIGPYVVAADKVQWINAAEMYFIANEININQKTDMRKQADKLSPVLTGGFAMYEMTRAFIALENPSGREITSFALGVARIVLSVLDGFGSCGSPQPTFEEQVADAFQQVQEAISNLHQELAELILQVDQSLRTAVLDREADNLRDRAQFAMNTFHTRILDIADSRMSTANETLRRPWRVSSDARDRLMQEAQPRQNHALLPRRDRSLEVSHSKAPAVPRAPRPKEKPQSAGALARDTWSRKPSNESGGGLGNSALRGVGHRLESMVFGPANETHTS
ncbi:unnamed protein product [Effrenium voratum]|nr:unnamed protein product [Effrenium voratum]